MYLGLGFVVLMIGGFDDLFGFSFLCFVIVITRLVGWVVAWFRLMVFGFFDFVFRWLGSLIVFCLVLLVGVYGLFVGWFEVGFCCFMLIWVVVCLFCFWLFIGCLLFDLWLMFCCVAC